jgi:hypothetical protein
MKGIWILMLFVSASAAEAGLFDYWGFRAGPGYVIRDNQEGTYAGTGISNRLFGGQIGVLFGLFLDESRGLCLQMEAGTRGSIWNTLTSQRPSPPEHFSSPMYSGEFILTPMLVYHLPSVWLTPFLQLGIESDIIWGASGPFLENTESWVDRSISWNIGGGLLIPTSKGDVVIDVRYNSDLIDQYEPRSPRRNNDPTKFNELHVLLGMNFDL